MSCGQPRYTVDLSIALSYMMLEACEQGLGTCWLGNFDENKIRTLLGIPVQVRVVAVTPLGYAVRNPQPTPRKTMAEIVCYEQYS